MMLRFTQLKSTFRLLFKPSNLENSFKIIQIEDYFWNKKPIKENSILVWDLENIPFSRLNAIKKLVKYTPEKLYVVTRQKLSIKLKKQIEKEQFKILDLHQSISDTKIIKVMKLYGLYSNMVLISSDSDFVESAKKFIKKSHLQWIMIDSNKKRIIMKMDISHKKLTISTIS